MLVSTGPTARQPHAPRAKLPRMSASPKVTSLTGAAAASSNTYSSSFLTAVAAPLNLALVILNVDRYGSGAELGPAATRFSHLWRQSSLRVCADGAANRLYDNLDEEARAQMLPDLITGDLDSLRGDVATFYSDRGVPIEGDTEQDSHDFEKCLRWLERRDAADRATEQPAGPQPLSVVAVGAFGGRLDQQMANLNMAFAFSCFERFYLISEASLAFVLPAGKHVIETNSEAEDGTCGLIPLGGRCDHVVTTGLRWNLDGERPLEFGQLISSSNEIVDGRVTVETSSPLLWTTGLRQR